MKTVGLKIEKGFVAAAVVQKDFRKKELVDSFSQPYSSEEELLEILRSKSREWAGARIISSIPGNLFTQRLVSLPFSDRKRVEKALPFELEDLVPFALDEVVVDHIVLGSEKDGKGAEGAKENQVLSMMLPREELRKHLELLASAGIDPNAVVPSYIGLDPIARLMGAEGCTLLACGNDICLRSGHDVKGLRSFSDTASTTGLRHTVQSLEIELKEHVEKICVLCPDHEAALAELGIALEQVSPELGGRRAADPLTLGLALSEQINFRKQEFTYHLVDEGLRRKKRTVIIAASIVAVLFLVNIGVKLYMVEAAYNKLDREIRAIYMQAVPDGKPGADPARQLRSNLEDAQRKYGALGSGTSVLDAMKAVTDGIPPDVRVTFQEFLLEADRLKLQGEAASFEAIDRIKGELQKSDMFADINVLDTRMGTDNKVKFRLDIKLKQGL